MGTALLDLTGGHLDLSVIAARDAAFILLTPSDLTTYTWRGQIRTNAGALLGTITIVVTSSQAVVTIPAAVTSLLPARSQYEIEVSAPGSGPVSLLTGVVLCEPGLVV